MSGEGETPPSPQEVILTGETLTIEDVVAVARFGVSVRLAEEAKGQIKACRGWVDRVVEEGELVVYGLNTGFGALADRIIPPEKTSQLSENLIRSHAVCVGEPLPEDVVRAALLIRANTLAKGHSGVRVEVIETLIGMLNQGVYPLIPKKGSVGASGDLAPLSHLVLVLMGEGEAFYRGKRVRGVEGMRRAGLEPVRLLAKEGLALNNGTAVSAAIAALALYDSGNLVKNAEIALAMTLEAVYGAANAFNERLHRARNHDGQQRTARNVLRLVKGSKLIDQGHKVQDAYSLRCAPQVIGAARDALAYVRMVVQNEINAATDNPLLFLDLPRENKALSGGNFHGEPLAIAMDLLGIAIAEVGNISERRIFRLMDPHLNEELPAALVDRSGLNSGLMILQYTAAALVSDNKTLAHPDSIDSIPTCANQEDHVSMSANAALHAREILWNVDRVVAIEMLCAAQALDFRKKNAESPEGILGVGTEAAYQAIRGGASFVEDDRLMQEDMGWVITSVQKGTVIQAVEKALGAPLLGLAELVVKG